MPELPEVETIKRDLDILKSQRLVNIEFINFGFDDSSFLIGKKLIDIHRHGKYLFFIFEQNNILMIHLRMTGKLILDNKKDKYARCIFDFDKHKLCFSDVRKFGIVKIMNKDSYVKKIQELGRDALDIDFDDLKNILQTTRNIKSLLLDQYKICGIGNIYADEILFASMINPKTPSNTIKDDGIYKLLVNTKKILKKSIEMNGTTFRDYVAGHGQKGNFKEMLKVYSRSGLECITCGNLLKKEKVAGRTTIFCDLCQK